MFILGSVRHSLLAPLSTLLFALAACDGDSTSEGAGGASGNSSAVLPDTITAMIPPEGTTLKLSGATVTFPAGAVAQSTEVTITATKESPPEGHVALSPIYECKPSGLSFAVPVTMAMEFNDDGKPATMFWSSGADPAFKDVGGSPQGKTFSAGVQHFSRGFVGRKP